MNTNYEKFSKELSGFLSGMENAVISTYGNERYAPEETYEYTKEEIIRIIKEGDSLERSKLSLTFYRVNGLYSALIHHYSNFLLYLYVLSVKPSAKKMPFSKYEKEYYQALNYLEDSDIYNLSMKIFNEVLVKGGYYVLATKTNTSVVLQDLPFEYCRCRFLDLNGYDVVELNLEYFNSVRNQIDRELLLNTYPKEIVKEYNKYVRGKRDRWLPLSTKYAFYLNIFEEKPFFLNTLLSLIDIEKKKEYQDQFDKKQLGTLITLEPELLKDGDFAIEPNEMKVLHKGAVANVGKPLDAKILSTYAKVNVHKLANDNSAKITNEDILDGFYADAGISYKLFNADTDKTAEFILQKDLAFCVKFGEKIAKFFERILLLLLNTKKVEFSVNILPVAQFNKEEEFKKSKELLAFGYSFLIPHILAGGKQSNLLSLKQLENDGLDLDSVLKPLMSSYTASGKNLPQEKEKVKEEEKSVEQEENQL